MYLTFIPRKALPALAQFAPERVAALELRLASLDPESPEMKNTWAELNNLISDFEAWAPDFLRQSRQAERLAACWRVQVERATDKKFLEPRLAHLLTADLTMTENERLMRMLSKRDRPLAKLVQDALKVLEKPWKHRDEIDRNRRTQR